MLSGVLFCFWAINPFSSPNPDEKNRELRLRLSFTVCYLFSLSLAQLWYTHFFDLGFSGWHWSRLKFAFCGHNCSYFLCCKKRRLDTQNANVFCLMAEKRLSFCAGQKIIASHFARVKLGRLNLTCGHK